MIDFNDLMTAFLFVSSERYGMHTAIFCKETGRIYYRSELGGIDEIGDEDLDEYTCIEIPHKNDLDLGQKLVFEFVETNLTMTMTASGKCLKVAAAIGGSRFFWSQRGCWRPGMNSRTSVRKGLCGSGAGKTR